MSHPHEQVLSLRALWGVSVCRIRGAVTKTETVPTAVTKLTVKSITAKRTDSSSAITTSAFRGGSGGCSIQRWVGGV